MSQSIKVDRPTGPKVFILSVHFQSEFWLRTQRRFLDKFVDLPHERIFASQGIAPNHFNDHERTIRYSGSHVDGLNALSERALKISQPNDWLVFLDSDAFPVAPLSKILTEDFPLIAVQRLENLGDPQPHPSFCAVRVSTWRELATDWGYGHSWTNSVGRRVSDVGANVLAAVERSPNTWLPLNRVNTYNLHELWFALYGVSRGSPLVYHHGAGSRKSKSRIDSYIASWPRYRSWLRALRLFLAGIILRCQGLEVSPMDCLWNKKTSIDKSVTSAIETKEDFWKVFC